MHGQGCLRCYAGWGNAPAAPMLIEQNRPTPMTAPPAPIYLHPPPMLIA